MIRIKLLDGEAVDTERHTYDQAIAAKDAGNGIVVGGPQEYHELDGADPSLAGFDEWPAERTVYPQAIASIERVPS